MNFEHHKGFNFPLIAKLIGGLIVIESFFLLLCVFAGLYYGEQESFYFAVGFVVSFTIGIAGLLYGRNALPSLGKREGSVIVTATWVIFSLIGLLPYWLSGNIPSYTNAFFETISGFTTTGASILVDIEALPKCMLFWRAVTHWIGGLGIIVISLAIMPIFGFTGMQLYTAEVTGLNKEKIHPKISGTAKRLLFIYLAFTVLQSVLLHVAGMSLFDSVCNSLSTVSTGGFCTKNANISYWNSPAIEWIVIVFMIASGINFSLYYFLFKGKIKKFFKDEEVRVYAAIILISTVVVTVSLFNFGQFQFSWADLHSKFRTSLFTVSSILTTTGFYSVDYSNWIKVAFFLLLLSFIGGCASSTSGGVKIIRVLLVFKYCYYEFKRIIHPNAVFPVRYNGKVVHESIVTRMLAYMLLFGIVSLAGASVLCLSGLGFKESISAMISCLDNAGPGLGHLGPIDNYSAIPTFSKWFLAFAMLVGRLEFFTVLLIFTPAFWRK